MSTPSGVDRSWFDKACKPVNVILVAVIWSLIALIVHFVFSVNLPGIERPVWYRLLVLLGFQNLGLIFSAILCWRNWKSPLIHSRRTWLILGVALGIEAIANAIFAYWEMGLNIDPTGCFADLFYSIFYVTTPLCIAALTLKAKIRLKLYQWVIVIVISSLALSYTIWTTIAPANAIELSLPNTSANPPAIVALSSPSPESSPTAEPPREDAEALAAAPAWVRTTEVWFKPLAKVFALTYVFADVVMLFFATISIANFWGKRGIHSQSAIAWAAICFYIADTWYNYATSHIDGYQTGFILEVFWVFGMVLFGVSAAIEFNNTIEGRIRKEQIANLERQREAA
jgi:hypothetical protein